MTNTFPNKGERGVRFLYTSEAPIDIVSIAVAGTFNNWNPNKNLMNQTSANQWEVEVSIPKGRHLYKIVVNGEQWILDPLNPNISEDAQNNSAMTIMEDGEVLIRTLEISEERPGYMYENYQAADSPIWLKNAVIYQLHIRAFTENGFRGLTAEELRVLVSEAHTNGIRVIMDWVMNRGSVDHLLTKTNPDFFTRNHHNEVYYEVPNREYFAGLNFENRDLRNYIITAMKYWVNEFDFDGFRLDDSDITPVDFLEELKGELNTVKSDMVLISQSYDEYHHIDSCDLTYDGNPRILLNEIIEGRITPDEFAQIYNSYKYSFPKGALRMSWLEEKEQSRIIPQT